jgi:hypothetical protein
MPEGVFGIKVDMSDSIREEGWPHGKCDENKVVINRG